LLEFSWESVLFAIPLVLVLLAVTFRLDQLLAAPAGKSGTLDPVRPACGVDRNGRILMTDPDGRPWDPDPGLK